MTRDKAKTLLGENATEEQVTNFLNEFHNEMKLKDSEISKLNSQLSEKSDYDELKQKLNDIERENMSEQEKIAEMKKQAEKELKEARETKNKAKATEILAGLNLSDDIINSLVRDDENATIQNATNLKNQIEAMTAETIKKTKEELTTLDVKPNISNVNQQDDSMTWEKFEKLSQEEQNKFAEEHPDEFNNL